MSAPAAPSIRILCACGKKLNAPAGSEGKRARCPACGASVVIGASAAAQPQAAPANPPLAAKVASTAKPMTAASPAVAKRPTTVATSAPPKPVARVAPAAPSTQEPDPFQALCDAADEMALAAPATEDVPRCPQCRSMMGGGAVVCIKCGYDSRSGKRLVTEATAQKPAKKLFGGGQKKQPEDRMAPDGSFILGLILSTVFALAASLVWIGIAWATGLTIGYIAILIGAAAGLGMQAGHRGYSALGGVAAAGITFATIMLAKYTVLILLLGRLGKTMTDVDGAKLGYYFFSPIGLIIIAIGVGAAYKTANGLSSD